MVHVQSKMARKKTPTKNGIERCFRLIKTVWLQNNAITAIDIKPVAKSA
jgi:hypothetical protein